ncbi:Hypothetical protein GbCGDNIH3_7026 [Granulibacter bethesdensis]|uniref:Uncharacterized protein n=1 Tax=Granulibacter bethesdensis TaxID=364410 RepID=A0AAN0REB1_9PROT|nr:Hypothetical protein GbCGDNIH3_7026 [Granulibacter bethesdensis]
MICCPWKRKRNFSTNASNYGWSGWPQSFFHNVSRIKGRPISQWLFFCSIC